jgi:hypothetical protein
MNRDKSALYPPFAAQLTYFEEELAKSGLPFFLFEGLRSFETQQEYWDRGRTTPGEPCKCGGSKRMVGTCQVHPLGLPVTNARPGDSFHAYGLAADYVMDGDVSRVGIQWTWDFPTGLWLKMATVATNCGLESGALWKRFPDQPHVQNAYGFSLVEIKELYRVGGIQGVWDALLSLPTTAEKETC